MATRYPFKPGVMTWAEAADYAFRRSESWLRSNMPADFPKPDRTYGVFSTEQVEAWVRKRFGLVPQKGDTIKDTEARLLERVASGIIKSPVSRRKAA